MGRFPFGIPNGWYLLAYADELPAGRVERYRYAGRELVAFRGEHGHPCVADAYCPHLGAHLGVGGRVEGGTLRCPFHGWGFDATGRCVDVPYASRIPARARLRTLPSLERNGMIFFWHHTEDGAPFYELPDLPEWHDADFLTPWVRYEWTLRTHPQEMVENGVDWAHFPKVHRMDMTLEHQHAFGDCVLHWSFGASKQVTTLERSEHALELHGENWGLGYSVVRQWGAVETVVVTGLTPIDDETTHVRLGVIGKRNGESDAALRETLEGYVAEHAVVATEDFAIWENKLFRPRPLLCEEDGAIGEFRTWARRFYGDAAP